MDSLRRDDRCPVVLIVDDDEDTRLVLAEFLRFRGLEAVVAGSAKQAFDVVAKHHPDVIVMDYAMPGTDGISAMRELATDPDAAHIPVIIMTGHLELLTAEVVRAAGARTLILKPCFPDVLEAEVRRVLGGEREFRAVHGTPRVS
jgi:two-component system, cell cycle response regulator DivK